MSHLKNYVQITIFFICAFTLASCADVSAQVLPTPTPSVPIVRPAASPAPVQTLGDLQAKIRSILLRPEVSRGRVGIKIASLASGKVVLESDAEKYFMPASNMKNFTVAAALEKLSPDFRFVTSVYAAERPSADGTVNGNLTIYGRGDVSISTAFSEGNYYKGLDDLADKIARAGVKKVNGDLVGNDSYFRGDAVVGSWETDDLQWYYGAEVSALPINDNAIDLTVAPGPVGYSCAAKLSPVNLIFRVFNTCTTGSSGSPRTLRIIKRVNQNILDISGNLPSGSAGFSGSVSVTRPGELFVSVLKERLALKGVSVTGATRVTATGLTVSGNEIAKLESPPLALIAAKTLKPSQNMYTEVMLRTLGEHIRSGSPESAPVERESAEIGLSGVQTFLRQIGVAPDAVVQYDGSGLSRHNLITPSAVVSLYSYMARQSRYASVWREALPIAGIDGTLKNRFLGTRAAANLRGKTGTIDQVSALSGYLKTLGGDEIVLSIIVNGVPESSNRTSLIDQVVIALANFDGKIE